MIVVVRQHCDEQRVLRARSGRLHRGARPPGSRRAGGATAGSHRWNRNPRPQPQTFSKLVILIEVS